MTGLAAISHYNGWVMSVLGAAIVFSGLAVLSFAISQLPRLFTLIGLEEKPEPAPAAAPAPPAPVITAPERLPEDIHEAAVYYEPLVQQLGERFSLSDLHRKARDCDFPHPQLTISSLWRAGILAEQGDGIFSWNKEPVNG